MAYLDVAADEAAWRPQPGRSRGIRLGDAERRIILRARRDVQAGRAGTRADDARLEALRVYAMSPDRRAREAAGHLQAADFSPAERRVVDAMIDTLPARRDRGNAATGRIVCALAVLVPLLSAMAAYGWASFYLQDRLIALVLGGLAVLLVLPLVGSVAAPAHRAAQSTMPRGHNS